MKYTLSNRVKIFIWKEIKFPTKKINLSLPTLSRIQTKPYATNRYLLCSDTLFWSEKANVEYESYSLMEMESLGKKHNRPASCRTACSSTVRMQYWKPLPSVMINLVWVWKCSHPQISLSSAASYNPILWRTNLCTNTHKPVNLRLERLASTVFCFLLAKVGWNNVDIQSWNGVH